MGGVQMEGKGKGIGEIKFQMGKFFCPSILQPLLENFDRSNCNDGSWELSPIFHSPHRKSCPLLRR